MVHMNTGNIADAIGFRHGGTVAAQSDDHMLRALGPQSRSDLLQILLPKDTAIHAQRETGLRGGFLLIGDQIGHQTQQFVVQIGGGSRIQHDGNAGLSGPVGQSPVYLQRNLQLKQQHVIRGNFILDPDHFLYSQSLVGTGDDDDTVLRRVFCHLQGDMSHAGGDALPDQNVADIHASNPGRFQELLAEQIIAHATHHRDIGAQPDTLQRLVGTLAAGGHVEGLAINSLGGLGNAFCCGNHVHDEAADN